jgi:hypothetical protein
MTHDRTHQSLKSAAIQRQFRFEHRALVVDDRPSHSRNGAERSLCLGGGHSPDLLERLVHSLDPQRGVWIEADIFGAFVGQKLEHGFAQFSTEFLIEAGVPVVCGPTID